MYIEVMDYDTMLDLAEKHDSFSSIRLLIIYKTLVKKLNSIFIRSGEQTDI